MSLPDDVARYYAARAPMYDETAGYTDPEAEALREPIKARYRDIFAGRAVLEIACGAGYWTKVIAESAHFLLAVDIHPDLVAQAKARCAGLTNLQFEVADAYTLDGISPGFSAGFAQWWWSHVPRERLRTFLAALHGKLRPGALVLFVDQLPYPGFPRRQDANGNTLEQRTLPDGRAFEIVKNFPTETELRAAVAGIADRVQYIKRPKEKSWELMYAVRK
jgi:demethylmenaquinone methyltransferase/2-methoxy-6-polyprenyl-1,4-benzoquinol methylase